MPAVPVLLSKIARQSDRIQTQERKIENLEAINRQYSEEIENVVRCNEEACRTLAEKDEEITQLKSKISSLEKAQRPSSTMTPRSSIRRNSGEILSVSENGNNANFMKTTVASQEGRYQKLMERFQEKSREVELIKHRFESLKRGMRKKDLNYLENSFLQEQLDNLTKYVSNLEISQAGDEASHAMLKHVQTQRRMIEEQMDSIRDLKLKYEEANAELLRVRDTCTKIGQALGIHDQRFNEESLLRHLEAQSQRMRTVENLVTKAQSLLERAVVEKEQYEHLFKRIWSSPAEAQMILDKNTAGFSAFPNASRAMKHLVAGWKQEEERSRKYIRELERCFEKIDQTLDICYDSLVTSRDQRRKGNTLTSSLEILSQLSIKCADDYIL